MTTQTKTLTALRSRRQFQFGVSFQCRHAQFAAERRLPRMDSGFVNQIAALDGEIRMARQTHPQKKIAALPAAGARFALAGETDPLSFVDSLGNPDLVTLDLVRTATAQGNLPF